MKEFSFLSDQQRGIDPTRLPANDCGRIQNAPRSDQIPAWWIFEGTQAQLEEWKTLIESETAVLVGFESEIIEAKQCLDLAK